MLDFKKKKLNAHKGNFYEQILKNIQYLYAEKPFETNGAIFRVIS